MVRFIRIYTKTKLIQSLMNRELHSQIKPRCSFFEGSPKLLSSSKKVENSRVVPQAKAARASTTHKSKQRPSVVKAPRVPTKASSRKSTIESTSRAKQTHAHSVSDEESDASEKPSSSLTRNKSAAVSPSSPQGDSPGVKRQSSRVVPPISDTKGTRKKMKTTTAETTVAEEGPPAQTNTRPRTLSSSYASTTKSAALKSASTNSSAMRSNVPGASENDYKTPFGLAPLEIDVPAAPRPRKQAKQTSMPGDAITDSTKATPSKHGKVRSANQAPVEEAVFSDSLLQDDSDFEDSEEIVGTPAGLGRQRSSVRGVVRSSPMAFTSSMSTADAIAKGRSQNARMLSSRSSLRSSVLGDRAIGFSIPLSANASRGASSISSTQGSSMATASQRITAAAALQRSTLINPSLDGRSIRRDNPALQTGTGQRPKESLNDALASASVHQLGIPASPARSIRPLGSAKKLAVRTSLAAGAANAVTKQVSTQTSSASISNGIASAEVPHPTPVSVPISEKEPIESYTGDAAMSVIEYVRQIADQASKSFAARLELNLAKFDAAAELSLNRLVNMKAR